MPPVSSFTIEELPMSADIPLWLRRVDPIQGESLTSWVSRLSSRLQIPIPGLLESLSLTNKELRADLDVFPPLSLIRELSRRTGVTEERISGMSLGSTLPILIRERDRARLTQTEIRRHRHLPWITPSGWHHPGYALTRRGGTPYCPSCVSETPTPFSPLQHRLSLFVACPKHAAPLREDCPFCGAPSLVWALSLPWDGAARDFVMCWGCTAGNGNSNSSSPNTRRFYDPLAERESMPSILHFQELALTALAKNEVHIPQLGRFSGVQFFQGLRYALSAFNAFAYRGIDPRSSRPSSAAHRRATAPGNLRRLAFDFHPLSYRLKLTAWMAWLTERPLDRWPPLYRMSFVPSQLPRAWRHPWEAVDADGNVPVGIGINLGALSASEKVDAGIFQEFFKVVDQIKLTDPEIAQVLGGISIRTVHRWRMHPIMFVRHKPLARMRQMVRIWAGVLAFAKTQQTARSWMRAANHSTVFQGQPPLKLLLTSDDDSGFQVMASFFGAPHSSTSK